MTYSNVKRNSDIIGYSVLLTVFNASIDWPSVVFILLCNCVLLFITKVLIFNDRGTVLFWRNDCWTIDYYSIQSTIIIHCIVCVDNIYCDDYSSSMYMQYYYCGQAQIQNIIVSQKWPMGNWLALTWYYYYYY